MQKEHSTPAANFASAACAAAGWAEAAQLLTGALAERVYGPARSAGAAAAVPADIAADGPSGGASARSPASGVDAAAGGRAADLGLEGSMPRLQTCALLNASVCGPSVALTRAGRGVGVTIYNPLAWPRAEGVRVPVSLETVADWAVTGARRCPESDVREAEGLTAGAERSLTMKHVASWSCLWPRQTILHPATLAHSQLSNCQGALCAPADDRGAPVPSQLLLASRSTLALQVALAAANALLDPAAAGAHELAFVATLPPLGYVTYSLEPCSDAGYPSKDPEGSPRAARPLLERPGASKLAENPGAGVCARGRAAAASSRVTEWAPGRDAVPDLAGVGAGGGRDGRLSVGSGRLALVLDAATGRTVALRAGNAATELSTSAVGARASQRARGQRQCHRVALMRLVHVARVDRDAAS